MYREVGDLPFTSALHPPLIACTNGAANKKRPTIDLLTVLDTPFNRTAKHGPPLPPCGSDDTFTRPCRSCAEDPARRIPSIGPLCRRHAPNARDQAAEEVGPTEVDRKAADSDRLYYIRDEEGGHG